MVPPSATGWRVLLMAKPTSSTSTTRKRHQRGNPSAVTEPTHHGLPRAVAMVGSEPMICSVMAANTEASRR